MGNIIVANEILDLISYFYTDEYLLICEDIVRKQNKPEEIDKISLLKHILPYRIETNVKYDFKWLKQNTETIVADYILESGMYYLIIFLDKNILKEGRAGEYNKFILAHNNHMWDKGNYIMKKYLFVYYKNGYEIYKQNDLKRLRIWAYYQQKEESEELNLK